MAIVVSNLSYERKPWMLRDYLRDDMSSCSSNGFRSFPRKQCCVAVKNIIESEVIRSNRMTKKPKKMLVRNQSVSSALQRASTALINAVKLLPFHSTTAVSNNSGGGSGRRFLPRSFSKNIFKRSFFWKKPLVEKDVVVVEEEECDEIERWISSGVVATEKYLPLDLSNNSSVTNISSNSDSNNSSDGKSSSDGWSDITITSEYLPSLGKKDIVKKKGKVKAKNLPFDLSLDTSVTNISSNSNNSGDGKSNSDRWSDITFTSDYLPSLGEKDVVKKSGNSKGDGGDNDEEEEVVSKSIGGLVGEENAQETAVIKNNWCNEKAETEQLSPISVIDFPYNDDGNQSPFTLRVSRLKGTKERLMEKLGRFECLAAGLGLDPVNLESLMSSTETEDHSPKDSIQSCSTPSFILSSESETEVEEEDDYETPVEEQEDDESQVDGEETRVQRLLDIIKFKKANYKIESDNLLLDFLRENVDQKADDSLLKSAEDWLNGHYDILILGWEVKDKRQAYIRDMDERGRWPKDCKIEKEEVAIELGNEVLADLIQEVILQFC